MKAAVAPEYTPVFDWNPPRSRRVSLLSFIAASAVLHALCFYLFQIIYPPTIALLPPPARVNLITADSEEGRVLLRWIEAEDPALTSTTQRSPEAANQALPKTQHVPSYLVREPALKKLPPLAVDLSVPSSNPPAPISLPRSVATSAPSPVSIATEIKFDAGNYSLGQPAFPSTRFAASGKEPPQAAEFRVAITAQGEVRHCFLETSSGDPRLDEQAAQYLLRTRFPEMPPRQDAGELLWSTAVFEWGNDLASAETRATKS